ncbi:DegV family protein [Mycoplasma sp. Mirounga ES2805-ORL]|uniref:DegV family protein n=1 Tax=Mycoplasma sp. Mirounga ES2805-ORL TaxID=754514 RepID=UPI00197C320B|nr:DegV family protein [Mycoplasma sp. Mirounga ES2805-ORL]QSF13876.1 DegV family protein [Mycoplasma sp. Mirounga ES2805-ORL]
MKKIGFIIDSFSCETEKSAKEKGFEFFSIDVEIDGKLYEDGRGIDRTKMLEMIRDGKSIKTSLPKLGMMEETIKRMTKEYDEVIYVGISTGLSSSMRIAATLESAYKNFHIFENSLAGDMYLEIIEFIKNKFEEGKTISQIIEETNKIQEQSLIFILPQKINYLIEGGRATGFKKLLLKTFSKLSVLPYVKFYDNKVSNGGIARSSSKAATQIVHKLLNHVELSSASEINDKYDVHFIYGIDEDFNNSVRSTCEKLGIKFASEKLNASSIAVHTGPEAISLSIMPKINKK